MKVLHSQVGATTKSVRLILDISSFDYEEVHALNDSLKDGDEIDIKKRSENRSLNANSYYWSLINKIAKVIRSTPSEVHNKMLSDYGVDWLDPAGNRMFVQLPMTFPYEREETFHVKPTSRISENANGTKYRTFVLLKPSHMFDTKEFSYLLDGAIQEAHQIGIETEDDEWLNQIKKTWKSVN